MNSRSESWLRTFLIIFTGQAFSLLGSAAVNFALVWWLTAETGSATVLAYASIAAFLPQTLVSPLAGTFVDRWDRRITMIVADLFIAAMSVVGIALFAFSTPSVLAVIALIGVRSLGAAFHTPASQAAVPMYVPTEHLMKVAGWNFFLSSGVAMAGPVLGAFLMGVAPITAVIALDIVGALLAVGTLLAVRIPNPERAEDDAAGTGLIHEFAEGWRELLRHTGLLELTIVLSAVTLLYMPLNALFPLMTRAHFGGGALEASAAEFAFGGGMLLGSIAIGVLSARFAPVRLISAGIFLVGLFLGAAGLLPASAFWIFVVLSVAMGFTAPLFGAPLTAMFQAKINPSKLGRVMSLTMTMMMLMTPVGLLVAGPVAERVGVATWFAVSGALIAISGLAMWAFKGIRDLDAT